MTAQMTLTIKKQSDTLCLKHEGDVEPMEVDVDKVIEFLLNEYPEKFDDE